MPVKRAFYDFQVSPFSYDFLAFVGQARVHGFMETVFVPGQRGYQKCTPQQQAYRLEHLLIPLAKMSGGTATVAESRQHAAELANGCEVFPFGYTVESPVYAHLFGQLIRHGKARFLTASQNAQDRVGAIFGQRTPVTITVRESSIKPLRNSRIREWLKAAAAMQQMGLDVVFIPDTDALDHDFGFESCPQAALDPDFRAALYAKAMLNLGIGNGPMGLCFYSDLPYMMFRMWDEESGYPETTAGFLAANALPPGSQTPWRKPWQAVVWEPDNADVILKHVRAFIEKFGQQFGQRKAA